MTMKAMMYPKKRMDRLAELGLVIAHPRGVFENITPDARHARHARTGDNVIWPTWIEPPKANPAWHEKDPRDGGLFCL